MLLDLHRPAYTAMTGVTQETPATTPPRTFRPADEAQAGPAGDQSYWNIPLLGDLSEWFDWPFEANLDADLGGLGEADVGGEGQLHKM